MILDGKQKPCCRVKRIRTMSRWVWCLPLLLVLLVRAQENRVTFLPGTFLNVNVSQNETVQAVVSGIPPGVAFVTLQFHTQHRNATLSYTRTPAAGLSLTAVDVGLFSALQPSQTTLSLFLSSPDGDTVTGTGVVLPYSSTDPVPGACNIEFNLDVDPNIYIHYNLYETTIRFAPANLGSERDSSCASCWFHTSTSHWWSSAAGLLVLTHLTEREPQEMETQLHELQLLFERSGFLKKFTCFLQHERLSLSDSAESC